MEVRKKVLHFLPRNTFSGAENVVCQIISMFRGEIDMYYCCPEGPIRRALEERHIPYLPMEAFSVAQVRKMISREKPDLIQAHDMLSSVICAAACGKTPLVCHIHNNNFASRKLNLKTLLFFPAAMKARHIFWVSPSAMESFYFQKAVASKSSVLRNVIDAQALRRQAARADLRGHSHVVFLGRMAEPKNPLRLLRVLELVSAQVPGLEAKIIGSGELEAEVRSAWEQSPARDHIQLLGYQPNAYGLLQDGDLMLMTSLWEGTPMCALEAMALGVPIVSTPVDGLKDLVEPGRTGFLESEDQALADRCAEIIENPGLRRQLSENAQEKAGKLLDLEAYRQQLRAVYQLGGSL